MLGTLNNPPLSSVRLNPRRIGAFALLTLAALLIHGYHPYSEDSEIYLPGVLKILHPGLYPLNTQFFEAHAGHSFYPNLIAVSQRLTHLPMVWVMFMWQVASIFLLLVAAWKVATALFKESAARWSAVCLMAALLTLPLAGSDLYILDQYLNPRNLSAFAALFAIAAVLNDKFLFATLWLAFAFAVHPLMATYAIAYCALLTVLKSRRQRILSLSAFLPFGITLDPPPPAYHVVALRHPSHYLLRWEWYEWLGLIGPVLLFWWFARIARRRYMQDLELVSWAIAVLVTVAAIAALILSIPARFEALARLQPLRCLGLCYMLLIITGGGLLGNSVVKEKAWRWIALFAPLSAGMFCAQVQLFPASAHVEWPFAPPRNPWAQAFLWIRENTPVDALFALNPRYMELAGEDVNGFRARAERSRLADDLKDQGAASMFPPLATPWWEQTQDAKDWQQFRKEDFSRLRQKYGVSWAVIEKPGPSEFDCPFQNTVVRVCRVE